MVEGGRISAHARSAFTLVEWLIVVVILSILAMLVIPRVSHSIEGATEATLKQDLRTVRNAIQLFAVQHGGTLPGSVSDGTNAAGTAQSLRRQLWYFSNAGGEVSEVKHADYPFGPYLKSFPRGPLGPSKGRIAVIMVADGVPLSGESDPINPWKYDYTTGEFIFNWDALSIDGVTEYDDF